MKPASEAAAAARSEAGRTMDPEAAPMPRFTGIVLAFWAGSLWSICAVVAPTLFALEDRSSAGRLAARFFDTVTLIGVICALILFAPTLGRYAMPGRLTRARLRFDCEPQRSHGMMGNSFSAA